MNHTQITIGTLFAFHAFSCSESFPRGHAEERTSASTRAVAAHDESGPLLAAAHEAYLTGDYPAMGERIRDVLLDPTSTALAKENAYELLDKAFAVRHGALPSRFRPPEGVLYLQYVSREFVPDVGRSQFQVRFSVTTKDAGAVVGVTVRHLPDGVVMDMRDAKGKWEVRHDPPNPDLAELVLDSAPLDAPLPDGVVTVRLEMKDGTVSEGFLIAHGLGDVEAPTVHSPAPSESFADPQPLLRWTVPRTSRVPFENARTVIYVHRSHVDETLWAFARESTQDGEIRIGSPSGFAPATLSPGTYEVHLSTGSLRRFGPIELGRAVRVERTFHVVAR